ncbi:MAG: hypothetical protein ACR2NP_15565 [Pirellulaceae bacterium]
MSIEIKDNPDVELHGQLGDRSNGSPESIASALASELSIRPWKDWQKHFSRRKKPARPQKRFGGKSSFLFWVAPKLPADSQRAESLDRIARLVKGSIDVKSRDASLVNLTGELVSTKTLTFDDAILAVGIAALLPELAPVSDESSWTMGLANLLELIERGVIAEDDLVRQMLAVELPCLLAWQLPEFSGCASLADKGFATLVAELGELLDSDGCIEARLIGQVPEFLATWTRSWLLADKLGFELDEETQEIWEWFLRLGWRLLRGDGTSMMSPSGKQVHADLYQAALRTSTDREDRRIAGLIWPDGKSLPKSGIPGEGGTFSEWAGMGVLQSSWSLRSPRVAVTTIDDQFAMEVCCGTTLFSIQGAPSISINGGELKPIGEWDEVCWHSDKDVDYLELELEINEHLRLQRQVCLLRQHEALFFADVLLGDSPERIDYQLDIQPAAGVTGLPESETTEMYLQDRKIRSLLLPLALPEWRSARSDDRFAFDENGVHLRQSTVSRNLCAGFFADLNPVRSLRPRTWRTLTVGEELNVVTPDVAVAWRVRIGKQQWVIYRSLEGPGNRTFVGQNHQCDFFIGQFEKDGDVSELLTIEA